jgi:hypothetical protein
VSTRGQTKKSAAPAQSSKANSKQQRTDLFQRVIGIVTLKPAIYREIAHDQAATVQAGVMVVVVALILGILAAVENVNPSLGGIPGTVPDHRPLAGAIVILIQELLIWLGASWLIAAVARGYFHGRTDTGEMLRVFGYTRIFQVLFVFGIFSGIILAVVSIAGFVLSIVGTIIGIREAASFSNGRAAIVGIFAIVLVSVLVAFVGTFVLTPIFTTLLPT